MAGGEGFGSITWWGFSPALDLQRECAGNQSEMSMEDDGPLNVLIVGAGDCRHVLKTIALRGRHKRRKIHFYIIENNMELLARHLLHLTLALEPSHKMGLQEKTELFMELYGNTMIRQHTYQYLHNKSNLFIEMITDLEYADERMPSVDMSQLKFKERDNLEAIFKFWREMDPRLFNVRPMWDRRLRQYLGVRYDTRSGVYDWDLAMKLHELGAKVVSNYEYTRWRESGVAFESREGVYDRPNKTLASGVFLKKTDGSRVATRGYWGDMVTGPFIAFGIETEEKSLLKTANGRHTKNSEDITLHNLTALFHELQTNQKYQPQTDGDSSKIMEVDMEEDESAEECCHANGKDEKHMHKEFYSPIPCDDVSVHFLSPNSLTELAKKSKFQNLFNTVFISASMVQQLSPQLRMIFAHDCHMIIELAKYILDVNKEQVAGFAKRVTEMTRELGFNELTPVLPTNSTANFVFGSSMT